MEIETIRAGQVRRYCDSVYDYKIKSDKSQSEVLEYCKEKLRRCENEMASGRFDGCSNFPFGLNSYYRFVKTSDGEYRYTVCEPYCD